MAKTGLRVGELVHLLIEDIELDGGWLHVCNKTALGWRIKTGAERRVPLLPEVVLVLRNVIGQRVSGVIFLRQHFSAGIVPLLSGDRRILEAEYETRQRKAGNDLTREQRLGIAYSVWRDAGAVKADAIRNSFIRVMTTLGRPDATCPKSWRHTFATLLQDGNVDPLIRQLVLGHRPTNSGALGMTAHYTHTRPETMRQQIEQTLRLWPKSLDHASTYKHGGD